MILQVASLLVRPEGQAAFEAAFAKAERLLPGLPGYLSHELQHSVDRQQHYALLIEWRAVEDCTQGFHGSLPFQRWRDLLQDHLQETPRIEFFQAVPSAARPQPDNTSPRIHP